MLGAYHCMYQSFCIYSVYKLYTFLKLLFHLLFSHSICTCYIDIEQSEVGGNFHAVRVRNRIMVRITFNVYCTKHVWHSRAPTNRGKQVHFLTSCAKPTRKGLDILKHVWNSIETPANKCQWYFHTLLFLLM